jgi:hypothetical protein
MLGPIGLGADAPGQICVGGGGGLTTRDGGSALARGGGSGARAAIDASYAWPCLVTVAKIYAGPS